LHYLISIKMYSAKHIDMLRKRTINTKSVEASNFVLSKMYFSQHMNSGNCFALFGINLKCLVQNK
jgi:hypothetical protein